MPAGMRRPPVDHQVVGSCTDMDGPVKVCARIIHSSVFDRRVKTTHDGGLKRRLIRLICAGWLPHDLNPPGAASL